MAGGRVLLVEGKDDQHVIMHLCQNRGVPDFEIESTGSVDQLLDSFPVRLKASEDGDILGVLIDADTGVDTRWQSLRGHLTRNGYENVPENPAPGGAILEPPADKLLPRVGIWIMPDNRTPGMLEDFLAFLVPPDSRLFEHVKSSIAAIPDGERRFPQHRETKAVIHTWLAWQEEPGKPLGQAITARYLDAGADHVDPLITWITRLFFPQG